jgi:hypothetical protein
MSVSLRAVRGSRRAALRSKSAAMRPVLVHGALVAIGVGGSQPPHDVSGAQR